MLNIRKLFLPLLVVLNMSAMENIQEFQLATYDYKSAAVLPTFTRRNTKWAILSREGYGTTSKHTYDSFSGGRDEDEIDVTFSAAREFHEEAILNLTLGWDLEKTEKIINPDKTKNTWVIIARSRDRNIHNPKSRSIKNVTYLTNFTRYTTQLFNNFYDAREKEIARYDELGTKGHHRHTTEKDRIAKVRWSDLRDAIISQEQSRDPVYVCAQVMNPTTRLFEKKTITLRPILVITLRPFLLNEPYEQGENEKIRHYTQ